VPTEKKPIPPNTEWPADKIREVAANSGKPLEVECARAFMAGGWTTRLGWYFEDGARTRELDVLATKVSGPPTMPWKIRALISCKGFPAEKSPMTYSVSRQALKGYDPMLLAQYRLPGGRRIPGGDQFGRLEEIEYNSGGILSVSHTLKDCRPFVAFDTLERKCVARGKTEDIEFKRCGDLDLFEGADSALKAAFDAQFRDMQSGAPFATLSIPILILSKPFWDTCIDGGRVDTPVLQGASYQSNSYPLPLGHSRSVMTLIWSKQNIEGLVALLNEELAAWFDLEMELLLNGSVRG